MRRETALDATDNRYGREPSSRSADSGIATYCQYAAADLIELQRLEQRLEVAFAEAFIALTLDDFEEDRTDGVFGEDLQQQALAFSGRGVDENPVFAQALYILAVTGDSCVDAIEVSIHRVLKAHATC